MANRKRTKEHPTIYKTLHWKLMIDQHLKLSWWWTRVLWNGSSSDSTSDTHLTVFQPNVLFQTYVFILQLHLTYMAWSGSHSSCIYNCMLYLWNHHYKISFMARCTRYNIMWWSLWGTCDRSVVFIGTLVSSTNKTDCHDITEILLKVVLNTIALVMLMHFYIKGVK
jgi:hypothetical protein